MTHSLPPPRRTRTPLRRSGRYRALLGALAVMLLAVLPHVTFAASMMHGLAPRGADSAPIAHAAMAHAQHASDAVSVPCHASEGADRHGTATPLKPPCCIIGCGLLGFGPLFAMPHVVATGHRLAPPPVRSGEGGEIEPAERPPRPASIRT